MTPIGFFSWFYPRKWSCNVAAAMWRLGWAASLNSSHPRNDWAKCSQDAKVESEGRWAKCQEEVGHVRHVPRERFVNRVTVWPSKLCLLGLCLLNSFFGRIGIWDDTHNYWVTWASHTPIPSKGNNLFPAFFRVHVNFADVKNTWTSPGKLVSLLALWLKNWSQMVKNLGLEDSHSLFGFISGET